MVIKTEESRCKCPFCNKSNWFFGEGLRKCRHLVKFRPIEIVGSGAMISARNYYWRFSKKLRRKDAKFYN